MLNSAFSLQISTNKSHIKRDGRPYQLGSDGSLAWTKPLLRLVTNTTSNVPISLLQRTMYEGLCYLRRILRIHIPLNL